VPPICTSRAGVVAPFTSTRLKTVTPFVPGIFIQ
jgi:hypothetical protein